MAESTPDVTDNPPPETPDTPGAEDEDLTPGYKVPKQVDLKTLQDLDQDDESLVKYKQQLLGKVTDVLDDGGNNVVLQKLIFAVDGRPDIELDLTGDLTKFKSNPFVIKEGCSYRIKIQFRVQREIVQGLIYTHKIIRKGFTVDKAKYMVGSYGPKSEAHVYCSKPDDAPGGMMGRGTYNVKSIFTDDDKHRYLEWEWAFKIEKEWVS